MDPRPVDVEAFAGALLHPATLAAIARAGRDELRAAAAVVRDEGTSPTAVLMHPDRAAVLRALADALETATE